MYRYIYIYIHTRRGIYIYIYITHDGKTGNLVQFSYHAVGRIERAAAARVREIDRNRRILEAGVHRNIAN